MRRWTAALRAGDLDRKAAEALGAALASRKDSPLMYALGLPELPETRAVDEHAQKHQEHTKDFPKH